MKVPSTTSGARPGKNEKENVHKSRLSEVVHENLFQQRMEENIFIKNDKERQRRLTEQQAQLTPEELSERGSRGGKHIFQHRRVGSYASSGTVGQCDVPPRPGSLQEIESVLVKKMQQEQADGYQSIY